MFFNVKEIFILFIMFVDNSSELISYQYRIPNTSTIDELLIDWLSLAAQVQHAD
jgi:hypothetical protein